MAMAGYIMTGIPYELFLLLISGFILYRYRSFNKRIIWIFLFLTLLLDYLSLQVLSLFLDDLTGYFPILAGYVITAIFLSIIYFCYKFFIYNRANEKYKSSLTISDCIVIACAIPTACNISSLTIILFFLQLGYC